MLGVMVRFSAFCAAIFFSVSLFGDAHAEQEPNAWQFGYITYEQANGYVLQAGQAIYSTDTENPGAAFACIDGRLLAAFSVAPANLRDSFTEESPARRAYVKWRIGDGPTTRERWVRLIKYDVLMSRAPGTARPLYNAAIRGDDIFLETRKYGVFQVALPKPDPAVFNRFNTECGFTLKKSDG